MVLVWTQLLGMFGVCWQVWDVSIIDTVMKDFYNKSLDTMVGALQTNLTVSNRSATSSSFLTDFTTHA